MCGAGARTYFGAATDGSVPSRALKQNLETPMGQKTFGFRRARSGTGTPQKANAGEAVPEKAQERDQLKAKAKEQTMPLGILNNIPSIAAENQLTLTSNALNTTLEQLSSGSRINSGADDPAGLAIANGLQANIAALTQSVSNANDGVGELQLADGALAQVTNLLDTAVTLATESATGTVSDTQRTAIQAQYSSILAEINRIGTSTTYNSQAVFESGISTNLNQVASANNGTTAPIFLDDALTAGESTSVTAGGVTFSFPTGTGPANPNVELTTGGGPNTASTALIASGVLSIARGGVTTTYTVGTGAVTLGTLIAAINTGTSQTGGGTIATTGVAVAGGAATGLEASLVGGQLQVTDTAGNNDLAVTGEAGVITGTTGVADSTASTVQDLINAINSDTTVGAHAALVGGQLQITDPQGRSDLTVTTDDPALGAPVAGAPTTFTNTTTTGTQTPDPNELVGNTSGLTTATTLAANSVYSFTAGSKAFTFTANAGGTNTIGDLISAINNPATDPANLSAYLNSSGQFVVSDPNSNNDLAVNSTNTGTVLGTLTSPDISTASENIFLSDSTSIGSSQIDVTIGSLSTSGITNGSGGAAVNLATTDLSTQTDAQTALTLINQAIANVASTRGTLGASVNRLTDASNVINSQVQNLTSAENTITAADIPTAVANLTKYSILEQTGISALAQANQQQQLVLKLLQ
jgi:flagellin